jgi:ElaB/YqjD/DUF883 family membrane-anchored ribosome-binding protein
LDFGNTAADHHSAGVVLAPLTTVSRPASNNRIKKMDHGNARAESPSFPTTGAQFKDGPRSGAAGLNSSISDSVTRGKEAIGTAANEAMNAAGSDLQSLRSDLNSLKDTVANFVSQAGGEAAKSAREVTSNVAGQVSDVANDLADKGAKMASAASDHAKSFGTELENMARRNPIGALAGAVVIGVLIGLMGRRS